MKTITTLIILCIAVSFANAQTTIYHENMEVIDSMSSNTLTSNGNPGFNANTSYHHDGNQSYLGTFGVGDVALATSNSFNLTDSFVLLKFWHICKIEFFDKAIVQLSNDGGVTWTDLTCAQYQGTSANFCTQGSKFIESSYTNWTPGSPTLPDSTWWKEETFDVSSIIGNAANVMIRFRLMDLNNNGMSGRYGWLIDDIRVISSPCELTPPVINLMPPVLQGAVYYNGPYTYGVVATDNSGIGGVNVSVSVNGGLPVNHVMTNPAGDSIYTITPADTFAYGDTICYTYTCTDATNCANSATTQTFCFIIYQGMQLPYCDNFDLGNIWTDSIVSGSPWELGAPFLGSTNSAHSSPNAWDISLATAYLPNTLCYLTSPTFDFSNIGNASLSVWINYNTEYYNDGARIEYTTNAGGSWTTLGSYYDQNGINWYNTPNILPNVKPGWSGNSLGWKQASRKLIGSDFTLNVLPVQFRILFMSNATNQFAGFSIDDFCISIPTAHDVAVSNIVFPSKLFNTGSQASGKIVIKNYGSQTATNFEVNYSYQGVQGIPVNYAGLLIPGASDTVLTPAISIAQGGHWLYGFVSLNTDSNQLNDTLRIILKGVEATPISYCNDFETDTAGWYAVDVSGNAHWQYGNPNYGVTNSAHSGSNAWDINLDTAYSGPALAFLYSPCFDFTNACNAKLEFWQNRKTNNYYDGARIDIRQGIYSWRTLGGFNDSVATNWYTRSRLLYSGKPGWEGSSSGWIKCTYNLNAYSGLPIVQFRFVFSARNFSSNDGITIDDFCIIQPPPFDISIKKILEPVDYLVNGQMSAVRVNVKNEGCTPVTNFDIFYAVNGGASSGPFAYNGPAVAANTTVIVQLDSVQVPLGIYDFCSWVAFAADSNATNDTLCATLNGLEIHSLNYVNNFDSSNASDFIPVSNSQGTAWQLGTPAYGFTTDAHSGTTAWDINLNSPYGYYANCELLTPVFDLTTSANTVLYFYQKRYTEPRYDGMNIQYSLNGGSWTVLGTTHDPNAIHWYNHVSLYTAQAQWDGWNHEWQKSRYNLHNFDSAGIMRFKFVFTSDGKKNFHGISIDDFCIRKAPLYELGIFSLNNINADGGYKIGTTYTPTVTLKNMGALPVDSIPLVVTVNGNVMATAYYYPTLLPYQSVNITFAGISYPIPQGTSSVCVYIDFPLNYRHNNDTLRTNLVGVPTLIPTYLNNFDSLDDGWCSYSPDTATRWELGTPNFGTTNSAHSPPSCWDINLNTAYSNEATCVLYSPWFDFTNVYNPRISFWINYNTEFGKDGARLEATLDGGITYFTLGTPSAVGTSNWYNSNSITSSLKPAWTGNSAGWIFARDSNMTIFNAVANSVRFKFVFTSNSTITNAGFSIDDFSIIDLLIPNAASDSIIGNSLAIPSLQYFSATFSNSGIVPLNDVILSLKDNSTLIVSDTVNPIPAGQLSYLQQSTHAFSQPVNLSPGHHKICCYTSLPNGAIDLNTLDDTVCMDVNIIDTTSVFPYCNNFESGDLWQTINSTNYLLPATWILGMPVKPLLSGTHSGSNAWVTLLAANYPANDNSSLFSTAFDVDSGNCYELDFWHFHVTPAGTDGGTVEYSTDSLATWNILGNKGDPVNWFNTLSLSAFGTNVPGWSGIGSGWKHASHIWSCYQTGHLVFRWRFRSNAALSSQGWAIDDVCFVQIAAPCYLRVNEINQGDFYLYQNIPNPSSGTTEIQFYIPHTGQVKLDISNVLGQIVSIPINKILKEGKHSVTINEDVLSGGVYNYTLQFDEKHLMRTMIITK